MGECMYRSTLSWPRHQDAGEWSASRSGRFTPEEKSPGTHWTGGWVDPRAGLDDVEKIPDPTGARTRTSRVVQPVASRYADYTILAPTVVSYPYKNGD
jgi:hypothetical protein